MVTNIGADIDFKLELIVAIIKEVKFIVGRSVEDTDADVELRGPFDVELETNVDVEMDEPTVKAVDLVISMDVEMDMGGEIGCTVSIQVNTDGV